MKILIIRFSSLGDVVLTTSLFSNLKKKWPDSEITVLTKPAFSPVFDNNPFIDHVKLFDSKKISFAKCTKEVRSAGFDILIDLQSNMRSWFIRFISGVPVTVVAAKMNFSRRVLVWFKWKSGKLSKSVRERNLECLDRLEVPVVVSETKLFPSKDPDLLRKFDLPTDKKLIAFAPGAMHATKRWTPEGFAEAANRLGQMEQTQLLFLGDKNDRPAVEAILPLINVSIRDLVGQTTLSELITIVSKLTFLLTNDSGLLHVAEALKIPLVALFGPTVRAFGFAPYQKTSRVVEVSNLPCRPCSLHGDDVCPLAHHRCMKDLDVNAVLMAASMLMDKVDEYENSMPRCEK